MFELTTLQKMDIHWAQGEVAKGVKPVALACCDMWVSADRMPAIIEQAKAYANEGTTACYLDMVREPERSGKEHTGGNLLKPVVGFIPSTSMIVDGHKKQSYSLFFAANKTMADLLMWAFPLIAKGDAEENKRAHAIVGLLCGYSPLAIEGFLEQPDK